MQPQLSMPQTDVPIKPAHWATLPRRQLLLPRTKHCFPLAPLCPPGSANRFWRAPSVLPLMGPKLRQHFLASNAAHKLKLSTHTEAGWCTQVACWSRSSCARVQNIDLVALRFFYNQIVSLIKTGKTVSCEQCPVFSKLREKKTSMAHLHQPPPKLWASQNHSSSKFWFDK